MSKQPEGSDKTIEEWKIKRLIQSLEAARGNGTSMISLMIPPKDSVSRSAKLLREEYGTASNIKSRVNRLSVLSAITSVQQKLTLYSQVPENGLVIFCGSVMTTEGKEKQLTIDFEPFKPLSRSLYLCDNKFHVEALKEMLESDSTFGFVIMDGNGCLFGTLSGNTKTVLHKFSVDLPKKHGRGGQSALRFARLRLESRHNYVRKVAETAAQLFINGDRVSVAGIVLAGSASFKNELQNSTLLDGRLREAVVRILDVSYGGANGFNQAIELASDALSGVKLVQEKRLLNRLFDEISQDSGKYCFGVADTLQALELGAVETLVIWEDLALTRYVLQNSDGEQMIKLLRPEQEEDHGFLQDDKTNQQMEIMESSSFLDWIAQNYAQYGTTLEFITDQSQEGSQFCRGFGGLGGILRYQVDFLAMEYDSDEDD
eukprot:CAMPEP_0206190984 /NCGR_PEP_ID=MMETSP0166-20121206/5079_1 /ASSEMBLY_ACC=CAM_ASM_000260 /TAXON_ID=95228 /ORGANISM="Vannella robusta, Strain DIVA3 518/3/11/1/6" /LENGTH=429 /DNA_ID=CAMNT_0053607175 /DNA_START=62 /DNA_END=1351 /DNA_ORIENTATION=+